MPRLIIRTLILVSGLSAHSHIHLTPKAIALRIHEGTVSGVVAKIVVVSALEIEIDVGSILTNAALTPFFSKCLCGERKNTDG